MCAWHLFDGPSRQVLRTALDADDDTWRRGRAWAASAALQALPYYRDTNPDIVSRSLRTARAILQRASPAGDHSAGAPKDAGSGTSTPGR